MDRSAQQGLQLQHYMPSRVVVPLFRGPLEQQLVLDRCQAPASPELHQGPGTRLCMPCCPVLSSLHRMLLYHTWLKVALHDCT